MLTEVGMLVPSRNFSFREIFGMFVAADTNDPFTEKLPIAYANSVVSFTHFGVSFEYPAGGPSQVQETPQM